MPRTSLPPTPAASGDISGKDGTQAQATDKTFNLPPPALSQTRTSAPASNPKPIQPAVSPNFSLPPPPTRSRTIIQMKPKTPQNETPAERRPSSKGSAGSAKKTTGAHGGAGGKKQPSSTSVAGKKIARKTAHSVIERRRRSKMNEEFGVLKGMIPACVDQEMHKLAILQASIDYLRYLENCITDLKAANKSLSTPLLHPQPPPPCINTSMPRSNARSGDEDDMDEDGADEDEDEDITMEEAATSSASLTPALSAHTHTAGTSAYTSPQSMQNSPALDPPHTSHRGSYSSLSTLPSPAFGPQKTTTTGPANATTDFPTRPPSHHSHSATTYPSLSLSASTSPTLLPSNKEQDHEATAALLMLNQDRRNTTNGANNAGGKGGRGMSVKDLLSC